MALVEPNLVPGFRDFPPDASILRTSVVEEIRDAFESFGFDPIRTPAVERADNLVGQYGPEREHQVYRLAGTDGDVALRPDLTVPLARHVALNHASLRLPLRRYQTGMIFSAAPWAEGRSRESLECDADIVGSHSRLADAECLALAHTLLQRLGLDSATICINNRKIHRGLQYVMGLSEARLTALQRALNRRSTHDDDAVRRFLTDEVKLNPGQIEQMFTGLTLPDAGLDEQLDEAGRRFSGSELARAGVAELRRVIAGTRALGVPDSALRVDLFTTRSIDYYTSTVFKTVIPGLPGFGSVISGGRYDDLVGIFLGRMVPAVGLGVRVDGLVDALNELGSRAASLTTVTRAMVLAPDPARSAATLQLAMKLRAAGVPCEFALDPAVPLHQQVRHAQTSGVPFAVLAADDDQVALQSLADGRQATVAFDDAVTAIRSWMP
jgi:histidyl-tRNA synthetase